MNFIAPDFFFERWLIREKSCDYPVVLAALNHEAMTTKLSMCFWNLNVLCFNKCYRYSIFSNVEGYAGIDNPYFTPIRPNRDWSAPNPRKQSLLKKISGRNFWYFFVSSQTYVLYDRNHFSWLKKMFGIFHRGKNALELLNVRKNTIRDDFYDGHCWSRS